MNAEKLVVDWLNTDPGLRPATASLSMPPNASSTSPTAHITVERTGGPETPFVSRPLLAIQTWAASRWNASHLAVDVARRVRHITEIDEVSDVADGRPRYQITCQLTIKTNYTESEEA